MPSEQTVLADRYRLLRSLGAGPVGEVWEGHDLVLDQPVAVKVVHDHLAAAEASRARLRSLAREAARVQHPNAVGVHDVDEDGRFVVMELVEGTSTRNLLAEQGPLSPEAATRLAAGACSALSAAHAVGVLHRGLKPENLLVTPDGAVKVTDFALSRTVPDPGLAAVRYLAPEELATGQFDDRSDLYALGCCLYELLCGHPPFDGPTSFAVASAHVNDRPRRPRSIRPDLPEALEPVIAKALSKHPNNRFQTPAELRQALQHATPRPAPPRSIPAASIPTPSIPTPSIPTPVSPLAPKALAPPTPGTPEPHPPGIGAPEREGSPATEGPRSVVHTPPSERARTHASALEGTPTAAHTPASEGAQTTTHAPAPEGAPTVSHTPAPASEHAATHTPMSAGGFTAGHASASAARGAPPERRRMVAALLAVGLVAGTVAVLAATRPSGEAPSSAAARSASTAKRPASAVSPATSTPQLVPVVAGATQAEAIERLRQAGMAPETIRRVRDDEVRDGHAVGTRPAAGETLRPGERLTLVISTGASPDSVADLIALIDANPRAAGPRAPTFRTRLARLDTLNGQRRQAEVADLLRIARAGASNGDFSPSFSASAVRVLRRLA